MLSSEEAATARVKGSKDALVQSRRKCGRCWQPLLTPPMCFCEAARGLQARMAPPAGSPAARTAQRIRWLVYMHRNDYLCGGNSGKLLQMLFPESTSIFVADYRPDEERLAAAIEEVEAEQAEGGGRICVLFPGTSAVTLEEWSRGWRRRSGGMINGHTNPAPDTATAHGGAGGALPLPLPTCLSVVLIDGTWRQARRLAKRLAKQAPSLSQVVLDLSTKKTIGGSGAGDHNDTSGDADDVAEKESGGSNGDDLVDTSSSSSSSAAAAASPAAKQQPYTSIFRRGARSRQSQRTRPKGSKDRGGGSSDAAPPGKRALLVEGRICTAEAAAMLLDEACALFLLLGAGTGAALAGSSPSPTCSSPSPSYLELISEVLRLNNLALAGGASSKVRTGRWAGDGGHPAWYFGTRVVDGREATEEILKSHSDAIFF